MGHETSSEVDIRCNLLDMSGLKFELKRIFKKHGFFDILVCNAGTGKVPSDSLSEFEIDEYFREKNFTTAENLLVAARPYLKIPGASIIGISSIVALTEIPGVPKGYTRAKRDLNQLFREKALEFAAFGIRVNLISPGNIFFSGSRWEEIIRDDPRYVEKLLLENVPLHNFVSPDEIASAILYLSSEQAKNITGTNLVIDGGQSL